MPEQLTKIKERIGSIDVLRGLSMFLLMASGEIGGAGIGPAFIKLFNLHPSVIEQFGYTKWEGLTIHYLIMPVFIFVSGMTIPFSTNKRLSQCHRKRDLFPHIFKRVLVLYLLGLIAGAHLFELKQESFAVIPLYNNVLQYIGISYLVCSTLILMKTSVKTLILITVGLLVLYWMLFLFIPVPGWEGGRYSVEMNLTTYVDDIVLGSHRPEWRPSMAVLGTINFIANMLLGVLMSQILRSNRDKKGKITLLIVSGSAMLLAGFIWGQFFPIIRGIWSSSYVLVNCGISALLFVAFYLIIDVYGYAKWSIFLLVFGVNSIAIYFAAHIYNFRLIGNAFVGGLSRFLSPNLQNFVEATAALTVMWLILYWMYRKKTFLKV
ncbi:acyltransferase family protein [Bacteroidota bacterium]